MLEEKKNQFISDEREIKGYTIKKGTDINDKNNEYPDRYLLLSEMREKNSKDVISVILSHTKYQSFYMYIILIKITLMI